MLFVLEHPEDPQQYRPDYEGLSLWVLPELLDFTAMFNMHFVSFDQGATGHASPKPTRLLTSGWQLHQELQKGEWKKAGRFHGQSDFSSPRTTIKAAVCRPSKKTRCVCRRQLVKESTIA